MKAFQRLPVAIFCSIFGLSAFSLAAQATRPAPRPTVPLTEGPFYKAGSPERSELAAASAEGRHITISGAVYDLEGKPIPGAWLDFWQSDSAGRYDNVGFRFRGHQLTDAAGRYVLKTVVPGEYPGRTPHFHVKLRAPGGMILTTQIFFPGNAANEADPLFDKSLIIAMGADGKSGTIDFVIPGRKKLDSSIPYGEIMYMDPKDVDPSGLPLTDVGSMHSTGTYQYVELADWRLIVKGPVAASPLSLSYEELGRMPTVKKRAILICSGFFYDYLEWEGVPLSALLAAAGVKDFKRVTFTSVDGYSGSFTKAETDAHLIMVATRGNGVPLPRAHGFPARVVAEDTFGNRWVKYLKEILVQ